MKPLWTSASVIGLALGFIAHAVLPALAGTAVVLADAELDGIDAGSPVGDERPKPTGPTITASAQQTIAGSAQQAASAVILVNALNSTVSAQVNVIVNSGTISHASQANSGTLPR
jgi:hypothetical protein